MRLTTYSTRHQDVVSGIAKKAKHHHFLHTGTKFRRQQNEGLSESRSYSKTRSKLRRYTPISHRIKETQRNNTDCVGLWQNNSGIHVDGTTPKKAAWASLSRTLTQHKKCSGMAEQTKMPKASTGPHNSSGSNIIVHLWDAIVWSPETTDTDPLGLLTVLCQELHTMRQVVLMLWQIAVFLDKPCAGRGRGSHFLTPHSCNHVKLTTKCLLQHNDIIS